MADRRGVGLLDAYRQYVGDPFASMVGGAARGYLGLDKPTYANEEAYRTAQAIGNMPGFGAPAGIFKAAANAPEAIAALGGLLGKTGVGKLAQSAPKPKAPQDEALEIARKNAVKMLGLPESNTAIDRARAMGFEEGIYHGATNDFPAFKVSDRSNVYATGEPRIADIYANAIGRHRGLREVNAGPNVMPLMYRGKLIEVSDQGLSGGGWVNDNLAAALGTERKRNLYKEVPSKGYSGVKITEMDDLGGRQSQYVFPDPSVLRSRFAAFDPARVNENDLLGQADPRLLALIAAGTGGGLLGYNYLQDR
jgi:hypothetical protein